MFLMYIFFLLRWAPEEGHSGDEDVAGDAEGTDVRSYSWHKRGGAGNVNRGRGWR
jgi:hypothetical protein